MPINTHGSGIRVETNVNGVLKDNDEWVAEKALLEHQTTPTEPWHQGYVPPEVIQQKVAELYEEFRPVEADPEVLEANKKDLKSRNLN